MYARLFRFKADPGRRADVEASADKVYEFVKTLKGFDCIHFIISTDECEYGSFSVWESEDDALAAVESLRSKVAGILNIVTEPPTTEIFEVYKPR